MLNKTLSFAMGCCSCFGFIRTPNRQSQRSKPTTNNNLCQEPLLDDDIEDEEGEPLYNDEVTNNSGDEGAEETRPKRSEEILNFRVENGMICRQFPVKETRKLVRSEVIDLWEWLYSFFCKGDFEFLCYEAIFFKKIILVFMFFLQRFPFEHFIFVLVALTF